MNRLAFVFFSLMAAILTMVPPAHAQAAPGQAPGHQMGGAAAAMEGSPKASTPASQAYMDAMRRMDANMSTPLTGDADVDFVGGMLPHHKGAIDMAEIELKYGKDPQLKRLARAIVSAQNREIAEMQAWMRRHRPASAK